MKRFAAHYLLLPDVGFIRQQVVEIADEGYVRDVFPLTEEIESEIGRASCRTGIEME